MKKVSLIMAGLLIIFLTACGGNNTANNPASNSGNAGGEAKPIKIGVVLSTSGTASSLGKPEMDTVKMLAEKTNAAGGINGRKVELITYDDKSDQNEAVLSTKKLIEQDKVVAIIGGSTSGNSLAMIPLVEKAKIPFISVASSKQIISPVKPFVFKTAHGDDTNAMRIIDYLKKHNLTKVAWLNVDNAFGSSGKTEFDALVKGTGIEVVSSDVFEATVNDAKPMLTRVKNANPQVVIVWGTNQEASVITKNIRELGIEVPIIGGQGIASDKFIELAGDAANGVIFSAGRLLVYDQLPADNKQKKGLEEYAKEFQQRYNYPANSFGTHAWDAYKIFETAIKTAGDDPLKIRDAIETGTKDFVGMGGIFNMSKENHNGLDETSMAMIQIKDKKWKLVE
jgi:branched-chain amino acid transport system substrate-binding protein